jgi:hypothetical protein
MPPRGEIDPIVYRLLHPRDPSELFERIVRDKLPRLVQEGHLTEEEADILIRYLLAIAVESQVASSLHEFLPMPAAPNRQYGRHFMRRTHSRLQHSLST